MVSHLLPAHPSLLTESRNVTQGGKEGKEQNCEEGREPMEGLKKRWTPRLYKLLPFSLENQKEAENLKSLLLELMFHMAFQMKLHEQ